MFHNVREMSRLLEAAKRDQARSSDPYAPNRFYVDLYEAIQDPSQRPDLKEIGRASIRRIFEAVVPDGRAILESWRPGTPESAQALLEGPNSIQTTDFSNITGQLVFAAVLEAWEQPQFIGSELVTEKTTDMLDQELIPGISGLGDMAETFGVVDEGESYPLAGVSEEYITVPKKRKRGFIVPITKEAIIGDKTGLVIQRASAVSESLALNKEKRILHTILGLDTIYSRNGSVATATYADSGSAPHDFDNLNDNALNDETDIEVADQILNAIVDPNTGEPIVVSRPQLLVPQALRREAFRMLNATEVRETSGTTVTLAGKSLEQNIQMLTSPYVKVKTSSDTGWYYGDFKKAFAYYTVWPITTEQAPANSEAEFRNDIVSRFKVSEMGTTAVEEPRYVYKSTGTA